MDHDDFYNENDDEDHRDRSCFVFLVLFCIISIPICIFSQSLKTKDPKFYVKDLFIPSLNATTQSPVVNTFIFVDLELRNEMPYNGLRYGDLNVTFFYGGNRSFPVADYTLAGFYQGIGKTAHKTAVVRTRGLPWGDALDRISKGLKVDFAVELAGTVKLRRWGVYLKRKPVAVAAVVSLDGSGREVDQVAVLLS